MPVIFGKLNDDWHKHWEGSVFVCLQNVEEIIIFKETHGTISNLQVNTSNAFNNSLEKFWDQSVNFVYFTHFKYFLQFSQEKSLFYTVSKRPVLQKSFEKWNCQGAIFGQKEH